VNFFVLVSMKSIMLIRCLMLDMNGNVILRGLTSDRQVSINDLVFPRIEGKSIQMFGGNK